MDLHLDRTKGVGMMKGVSDTKKEICNGYLIYTLHIMARDVVNS